MWCLRSAIVCKVSSAICKMHQSPLEAPRMHAQHVVASMAVATRSGCPPGLPEVVHTGSEAHRKLAAYLQSRQQARSGDGFNQYGSAPM